MKHCTCQYLFTADLCRFVARYIQKAYTYQVGDLIGIFRKLWAILHNFTRVQIVIVLFNCTLSNKSINIFDRIPHVYLLSSHLDLLSLSLSLQSVCFNAISFTESSWSFWLCDAWSMHFPPPLSGTHIIKHAHTHRYTNTLNTMLHCSSLSQYCLLITTSQYSHTYNWSPFAERWRTKKHMHIHPCSHAYKISDSFLYFLQHE